MKKLLPICLILIAFLQFSACQYPYPSVNGSYNDSYIEGIEYGHYETFYNLWDVIESVQIISSGETLETEHFSLTMSNYTEDTVSGRDRAYVRFNLALKNSTMKVFEDGEFLFYAFAHESGRETGREIFADDLFYSYASTDSAIKYDEWVSGKVGQASIPIYEGEARITLILATDGQFYKVVYNV